MLDFGMCRRYRDDYGRHIVIHQLDFFRGTPRYAPLASHKKV